jgi:hypothetical protein
MINDLVLGRKPRPSAGPSDTGYGWFGIDQAPALSISGLESLDAGESAANQLAPARDADVSLIDERIGR